MILALDLATVVGWALGAPGTRPRSGTRRIAQPGAAVGPFLHAFEAWLSDMLTVHAPAAVVFEAPFVGGKSGARVDVARKLLGLACMTELICYLREIRTVREVAISSVRKHFVGSGRADKAMVIAACEARGWGPIIDDNQADALACWDYACACLAPRVSQPTALFKAAAA